MSTDDSFPLNSKQQKKCLNRDVKVYKTINLRIIEAKNHCGVPAFRLLHVFSFEFDRWVMERLRTRTTQIRRQTPHKCFANCENVVWISFETMYGKLLYGKLLRPRPLPLGETKCTHHECFTKHRQATNNQLQ